MAVFLDAPVFIKTDTPLLAIMRAPRSVFGRLYIPIFLQNDAPQNMYKYGHKPQGEGPVGGVFV